jgi:hypothetical protein
MSDAELQSSTVEETKHNLLPTELDADGFPVPHSCELCSHLVLDASLLKRDPLSLFLDDRDYQLPFDGECFDLSKLHFDSCSVYRALRWAYVHDKHHLRYDDRATLLKSSVHIEYTETSNRRNNSRDLIRDICFRTETTWTDQDMTLGGGVSVTFAAFAKNG